MSPGNRVASITSTCGEHGIAARLDVAGVPRRAAFKVFIQVSSPSPLKPDWGVGLCRPSLIALPPLLHAPARNGESQLFDKVRGHDIKLLRYLSVRYICDLMVENKKVKFGLK